MRRPLVAAAMAACAIVSISSVADARSFTYGVSSAEVNPSSALLWARAPKAGKVQLILAENRVFTRKRITKKLAATKSNDLTVQSRVHGLASGKRYWFFFTQGRQRSVIGRFATAPKPTSAKTIRFAVTGDADGNRVNGASYWNKDGSDSWATYKAMTHERND